MNEPIPLRVECAGCKEFMRGERTAKNVSHGICDACLRKLYPEVAEEIINELKRKQP